MAYTITSESYGRRLPKIVAQADSTDDLATLGTDFAEGSVCTIDGTEYKLDKVQGWTDSTGGGGGGGGDTLVLHALGDYLTLDKTFGEIIDACAAGKGAIVVEETETSLAVSVVDYINYYYYDDEAAWVGIVSAASNSYSAVPTATLEALRAEYPSMYGEP